MMFIMNTIQCHSRVPVIGTCTMSAQEIECIFPPFMRPNFVCTFPAKDGQTSKGQPQELKKKQLLHWGPKSCPGYV